jgi:hypothetical protein
MVIGFADLHNHQFANLGFGGVMFWGSPSGPAPEALPWCTSAHGPDGTGDVIGAALKTFVYHAPGLGHKVGGYPQFDGWPRWDNSITHQAVHADMLWRAVQGGLRLMVMLAVNNEWMCQLPGMKHAPGRSCADMEAVDLQLQGAKDLQASIDAASGGPGRGWYRIVQDPFQARSAIEAGKLAVVLGVEVDYLFNGYLDRVVTGDQLRAVVAKYYDVGVRYVFPIHFSNNLFGGTAFQNGLYATNRGERPRSLVVW